MCTKGSRIGRRRARSALMRTVGTVGTERTVVESSGKIKRMEKLIVFFVDVTSSAVLSSLISFRLIEFGVIGVYGLYGSQYCATSIGSV